MKAPKHHAAPDPPGHPALPLVDRELEACRLAFESAGTIKALQDALLICAEQARPLPRWLTIGLLRTLEPQAVPSQQDVIDYVRFLAVCEARDLGFSWLRAYEYAAAYLAPIDGANGGEETMKKAYQRVAKGLRESPGRYFTARGDAALLAQSYQPTPEHAVEVLRAYLKK